MSNLFDFFIRYKNTLLFFLLLIISLSLTFQTHSFQRSKVVSSTNFISGGVYSWEDGIRSYFRLGKENKLLVEENNRLREQLYNASFDRDVFGDVADTIFPRKPYKVRPAQVIANRYKNLDNYILINRGSKDSIQPEYGVITNQGVLGVVEDVSRHYARVISILNTKLAINAQLKNSDHFGTLSWDGRNPNVLNLIDIPRTASVEVGDTIMTNGRSLIFPKGIMIGTVEKAKVRSGQNFYDIRVRLFNDMTAIGNVYVIQNERRAEADSLKIRNEK